MAFILLLLLLLLLLRGSTVWPPHISAFLYVRFRNKKLLQGEVISTTPNPQPGGPVDYT
jgi:hypothetical protein